MMKELTGACLFCGQTRIVEAEDQREADRIATENCACDNLMKRAKQFSENVDMVCGATSTQYGMEQLTEEVIDEIKQAGALCLHGLIDSAGFRVPDSTIGVKRTKDGVSISRKKVSSVKLEA